MLDKKNTHDLYNLAYQVCNIPRGGPYEELIILKKTSDI